MILRRGSPSNCELDYESEQICPSSVTANGTTEGGGRRITGAQTETDTITASFNSAVDTEL